MKLLRRLDYWVHQRQREADLGEEIEFHRAQSAGSIGNTTLAREDARAVWVSPWLQSVIQDLRYAVRLQRRSWSFAAVADPTLGLGIGTAATIFSDSQTSDLQSSAFSAAGKASSYLGSAPAL